MKWLIKKVVKFGLWLLGLGILAGAVALAAVVFYLEPKLPPIDSLKDVSFQVPLRVYSRDRKLIAEFGEKRRLPLTYDELPEQLVQAFLAAEDHRFFQHPGVDYQGLLRAATQLILTGEKKQGGSTITMQVARNFFLTRKKTYVRKLNEILLALKIERELSKEKILELYANKIYLGHRSYGVGAAAQVYYGSRLDELNLAQLAMIAGLPKAPSRYNPVTNPKRALERRNYVLGNMRDLGYITTAEYRQAVAEPVTAALHSAAVEVEAPYVAEMVRAEMIGRYGDSIYTSGYSVYTTIDSRLQEAANRALRKALLEYDLRHGYRGPERRLSLTGDETDADLDVLLKGSDRLPELRAGIVTAVAERSAEVYVGDGERIGIPWEGLKWARPYKTENRRGAAPKKAADVVRPGDLVRITRVTVTDSKSGKSRSYWRLAQSPQVEGALVSLDPDDGAILALTGGYDYYRNKFNRATQAERQPGSGFKAFIYSAALEAGFTPASLINDAPVVFDDPSLEGAWRPENYSGKFFGPTRLRYALTKSRNLVSIRLLRAMGIEFALQHIARFGFDPDTLPHNLSLALGSGAVTPLQMAAGYAILANGGYRVEPYFIERIEDAQHQVLFQAQPLRVCRECGDGGPQASTGTNPDDAGEEDAGKEGTGKGDTGRIAPRVISKQNWYLMNSMMRDVVRFGTARRARALGRNDLAGKTGTTNDQKDAWFNGFNRSLVAIAWVGFDSAKPLGRGEVGGRAALPAWMAYMKEALKGVEEVPLEMPEGITTVRIDPRTGKRAHAGQKDAIFEVFRVENAPTEQAPAPVAVDQAAPDGAPGTGAVDSDEDPF